MKTTKLALWISHGEHGQGRRHCILRYSVNGLGASSLYQVHEIKDAKSGEVYPLEATLKLNDEMDQRIVAADKKMVEFARVELHTDITKPKPKAKPKPSPAPNPAQYDLLPDIP